MRTILALIVWAASSFSFFLCHAQGTFVVTFDDLPAFPAVVPVGDHYARFGIHFGSGDVCVLPGVSNGDLGRWSLEGTAGPYFDGFNGFPGDQMVATFDTPITAFTLDASRANGSKNTTYFSLSAFYKGSLVGSVGPTLFGPINHWTTFSVSGPAIDRIEFGAKGLEGGFAFEGVFGVDNVRFTTVPEPSPVGLLAAVLTTLLARKGCMSLPNKSAAGKGGVGPPFKMDTRGALLAIGQLVVSQNDNSPTVS